jgi:hypothetical protein
MTCVDISMENNLFGRRMKERKRYRGRKKKPLVFNLINVENIL